MNYICDNKNCVWHIQAYNDNLRYYYREDSSGLHMTERLKPITGERFCTSCGNALADQMNKYHQVDRKNLMKLIEDREDSIRILSNDIKSLRNKIANLEHECSSGLGQYSILQKIKKLWSEL